MAFIHRVDNEVNIYSLLPVNNVEELFPPGGTLPGSPWHSAVINNELIDT